jgi:predicted nucleic acid-binding protein
MRQHFIDTSAFIAQTKSDDDYHLQAADIAQALKAENSSGVTTNFVLSETITFLQRTSGHPSGI